MTLSDPGLTNSDQIRACHLKWEGRVITESDMLLSQVYGLSGVNSPNFGTIPTPI